MSMKNTRLFQLGMSMSMRKIHDYIVGKRFKKCDELFINNL